MELLLLITRLHPGNCQYKVLPTWLLFMRVLLLRLLLCSDLNLWNLFYLRGLLSQIIVQGFSEEAWGRMRSPACLSTLPAIWDFCPSHFLSLLPSSTVSCWSIGMLTGASEAFSSFIPHPSHPDFASVSSCKSLKIWPLSWCSETSQWCVWVRVLFQLILPNTLYTFQYETSVFLPFWEMLPSLWNILPFSMLSGIRISRNGVPTYLYVSLHIWKMDREKNCSNSCPSYHPLLPTENLYLPPCSSEQQ